MSASPLPESRCACASEEGSGTCASKYSIISPNCYPLQAILDARSAEEDPSIMACKDQPGGNTWPVLLNDPSCAECIGDGMVAVACVNGSAGTSITDCCNGTNRSCGKVCPRSSACDRILGGYGGVGSHGLAFSLVSAVDPSSNTITDAKCGFHPITGEPIPSCPLMTAIQGDTNANINLTPQDAQNWCDCNPEACNEAMRQFCSSGPQAGNPWTCRLEDGSIGQCENGPADLVACMCWNPGDKPWGTLKFGDLASITAFQGSTFPLQCLWPPCRDMSGAVLARRETDAIRCPSVKSVCMNIIQDVHLENVSANSITLGECIQAATGANIGKAFDPQQWLQENPWVWISGLAILGVIVLVLLIVAFRGSGPVARYARHKALLSIQKDQTRFSNRLAKALEASPNTQARQLGDAIKQKRAEQLKDVDMLAKLHKQKADAESAQLKSKAESDLDSARKLAKLQVKEKEAADHYQKLRELYTL